MPFCVVFANLGAIATDKNALVKDGWIPRFLRPFSDWEVEEVNNFLLCLSQKIIQPNVEDMVSGGEEKAGLFHAKSLFKVLDDATTI